MENTKRNRGVQKTEITVVATIKSEIDQAFNYIAPINLMHIFRGNAMIPAIVDTSVKQGWNKAGLQRTVHFADGSTSNETLLKVDSPTSFSYKNERFSSNVLSVLLKRLEGEWLFTDLGNNSTGIKWTYRAVPSNLLAGLFVQLMLMKPIRGMLEEAMKIIKNDLETGQLANGTTWNTIKTEQ